MVSFSLKKLLGRGGTSAPTIPPDLNITIRRQHRRSLMMRPIPGGFEVYIPRWMRPDNPNVTTFIASALEKFGNQAPPIPPVLTSREQIITMVNTWADHMGLQPKRISFRDMTRKWGHVPAAKISRSAHA